MTALAPGLHVETGLRLRAYAALLPLNLNELRETLEREAADNPWLEILERGDANFSDNALRALASRGPSLAEHLEHQLSACRVPAAVRAAALHVIGALDERGYLREDLRTIAYVAQVSEAVASAALALVQGFDPAGAGARSLGERFRLQLADRGEHDAFTIELTHELETLADQGAAAFARGRGIAPGDLARALARLRACDADPTREFAGSFERVYPEIVVSRTGDGFEARLDGRFWPEVRLAALEVVRGQSEPMRAARARARLIVDALARRKTTLERLAIALLDRQRSYFVAAGDPAQLDPFSGRELARDLGCSESTISRALASRYMATPFGTIALRSLLVRRPGRIDLTTRAVRERLREVVAAAPHLSDDGIARALRLRGVRLARRTVSKYRQQLGLPSRRARAKP